MAEKTDSNGAMAEIAVVGLAVMGQNLAMNFADHGFATAVYNRTTETMQEFVDGRGGELGIKGYQTMEDLVSNMATPRKVMLMVKAGRAVDAVLDELLPLLNDGDVVIDGGNSKYQDTARRVERVEGEGILFVGSGVSGGEEGARFGPSIMPGGSPDAWPIVKDILQAAAADAADGKPCCEWLGKGGAGHFVKMVHNGIEYGDMQVIAEAYDLMTAMGMSNDEMAATFKEWNGGVLDSFLVEITSEILAYRDHDRDGEATIDVIVDSAGQKGTGRWTAIGALEVGQPLTLVAEAVFARVLSALRDQRKEASGILSGPDAGIASDAISLDDIRDAMYASKIVSYAQGFMLLRAASDANEWDLNLGVVASLWREGCIIRAAFLNDITRAFEEDADLDSLLMAEFFTDAITSAQAGWRRTIGAAVAGGTPTPAFSTALAFYDGYRRERLPANMIQAQRDYFGAHTYQRLDDPDGDPVHTNWTGEGGMTTAGSYST
jgi:6-phosphogluconate dehydrogenase